MSLNDGKLLNVIDIKSTAQFFTSVLRTSENNKGWSVMFRNDIAVNFGACKPMIERQDSMSMCWLSTKWRSCIDWHCFNIILMVFSLNSTLCMHRDMVSAFSFGTIFFIAASSRQRHSTNSTCVAFVFSSIAAWKNKPRWIIHFF